MQSDCQISLKAIVIILVVMLPLVFYGQTRKTSSFEGYAYLNVNGGITQYYGDLNTNDYYNTKFKPAFSLIMGSQFSPLLSVRGQLMNGKIVGENTQFKFIANLWDGTFDLSLNISNLISGYHKRLVSFYSFGGAGISTFSSRRSLLDGTVVEEKGKRYNKNAIYEFIVPFGIGASLALAPKVDLNFEYGNRILFSDDNLDAKPAVGKNDYYAYLSLGLTYKFNFFPIDNMWNLPRKGFWGLFNF